MIGFRSKIDFRKISTFVGGNFLIRCPILSQSIVMFRNFNHFWKRKQQKKKKIPTNYLCNYLHFYKVLGKVPFITIKSGIATYYTKLIYALPDELPNDVWLKILRNEEILRNFNYFAPAEIISGTDTHEIWKKRCQRFQFWLT